MDNQLKKEIEYKYASLRRVANESVDKCRNILLSNSDYIQALNILNSEKFEYSKAKYVGDKSTETLHLSRIKTAKNNLSKIIKSLGVDKTMLKPNYSCKACNDTGYLEDGQRCSCYNKILLEVTSEELGINKKVLPSFNDVRYTDKNNLGKYYQKIHTYCDKFGKNSKNLIISGNVGTGKSFMAGCIYSAVTEQGFNCLFLSANELNSVFIKYHTAPIDDKHFYSQFLTDCDLLVIDDLGCEPVYKNVTNEYLLITLNERSAKDLPTIITTNLTQDQLFDRYGERVISRINDKRRGIFLELNGEDLRYMRQ